MSCLVAVMLFAVSLSDESQIGGIPAWISVPAQVGDLSQQIGGRSVSDLMASYRDGETEADVFLFRAPGADQRSELRSEVSLLASAIAPLYDRFEAGKVLDHAATVGGHVLSGALLIAAAEKNGQVYPTYAFLYAVNGQRLEIRVTGSAPPSKVLGFVDELLPQMLHLQP